MFNPLRLCPRTGMLFLFLFSFSADAMQLPPPVRYWHGAVFGEGDKDPFSALASPSLLATATAALSAYSTWPFGMRSVPLNAVAAMLPIRNMGIGMQVMQFGNQYWKEQELSGGAGIRLGKPVQAGVQFGYRSKAVVQYGSSGQVVAGAGFRWKMGKRWTSAMQVIRSDYTQYFAGIGWQPSPDFLISVEGTNTIHKDYYGTVQALSRLAPALALQLAVTGLPAYLQTLVMITIRQLRIDIGTALHQQLGLTPSVTVVWQKQ